MKIKLLLTTFLICIFNLAQAQWTQGTQKLTTNDSIGIGVSSPLYSLDVRGAISTSNYMFLGGGAYDFLINRGPAAIYRSRDAGGSYPFNQTGHLVLQGRSTTGNARDIVFATGSTPTVKMALKHSGNLGIGTSTPTELLEITSDNNPTLAIGSFNTNTGGKSTLKFQAGNGTANNGFWMEYNRLGADDYLAFKDGSLNERMVIRNGGGVGIGNSNPNARLSVKGFQSGMSATSTALEVMDASDNVILITKDNGNVGIGGAPELGRFSINYEVNTAPSSGTNGLFAYTKATHTSGELNKLRGGWIMSLNGSTGSLNKLTGLSAVAGNENSATGHINNAYGVYTDVQDGSGTIDNGYGIFIKRVEATNAYGVYQDGANANNYLAGNLGIGISAPTNNLHIKNNTDHASVMVEAAAGKNSFLNFTETTTSGPSFPKAGIYWEAGSSTFNMSTYNGSDLALNENGGNVGIGTSSPSAKLEVAGTSKFTGDMAVDGKIESTKVKVTQTPGNWPDYVFRPGYNLLSLSQVESFINKNGHLPNVPKAEVVEKEGQDVGDIQARLLEKVEELMLYTIDQQKQIEALKKELEALKKKGK